MDLEISPMAMLMIKTLSFLYRVDGRIVRVNDYQQSTKSSSKYSLCKDQLDG